jgi:hypothetical protein
MSTAPNSGWLTIQPPCCEPHHLVAQVETDDAPTPVADVEADLSGPAANLEDRIAYSVRERVEEFTVPRFVVQLVQEPLFIPAGHDVVRFARTIPRHHIMMATNCPIPPQSGST